MRRSVPLTGTENRWVHFVDVSVSYKNMHQRPAIFLAEDSPADVYLFREALKAHDVETDLFVFHDGETAMSFLLAAEDNGPEPQLFVLDLSLPAISGLALLRHLRASKRFADSLVIILTSSDDPADRTESLKFGATCFLRKADNVADFLEIGRDIKAILRLK
ncbi:MAG: response regulator receiver protein [Bryobacterales bacterium]|jgi:DNA-binding response OmpR family regulator|nr:response regulator receiver protein [Bryobacterales bacterium]